MLSFALKSAAAIAAVAGLALTSPNSESLLNVSEGAIATLTEQDIIAYAQRVFARADLNQDLALDIDEYAALSVITAELAQLNGFIRIETNDDEPGFIQLPLTRPASLSAAEHARIAALAGRVFYAAAGADARMSADEFQMAQLNLFRSADTDRNGALKKKELAVFAARQANLTTGV